MFLTLQLIFASCLLYLACFLLYLNVMFIPADKRDLVTTAVPSLQQNLMLIATSRTSMPSRHAPSYQCSLTWAVACI